MSFVSSPRVPTYRITLFYGPERVDTTPRTIQCVFNVKKRSWKGGVQIAVVIEESQLTCVGKSLQFDAWLEAILAQVPQNEHADYTLRAHDLLAQQVCYLKLQLGIEHGIRQENSQLDSQTFVQELDDVIAQDATTIKNQILVELDIDSGKESS